MEVLDATCLASPNDAGKKTEQQRGVYFIDLMLMTVGELVGGEKRAVGNRGMKWLFLILVLKMCSLFNLAFFRSNFLNKYFLHRKKGHWLPGHLRTYYSAGWLHCKMNAS